ncbi:hypothetical protein ACLKA7_004525 [Drosophila subpalustris]
MPQRQRGNANLSSSHKSKRRLKALPSDCAIKQLIILAPNSSRYTRKILAIAIVDTFVCALIFWPRFVQPPN